MQSILVDNKIASLLINEECYPDKAITLFIMLNVRAGADLKLYTSLPILCDLLYMSNRTENKNSIMQILKNMEKDKIIKLESSNGKCFWIQMNRSIFRPAKNYTIIYLEEFEKINAMPYPDKLFLLLYCIKKYKNNKSNVSYVSMQKIQSDTGLCRPTIHNGIEQLKGVVLDVYQTTYAASDGSIHTVNFYKSLCDGIVTKEDVDKILKR